MRRVGEWAHDKFATASVARLATADDQARPHIVPIVFAVVGETIYTAIDDKPKSGKPLRRLANLSVNPMVSVLVDHYADDWSHLWWARADGRARRLEARSDEETTALAALADRYRHYRDVTPPGPVIAIDVTRWSGWTYSA